MSTHNVVVVQPWEESERGWGVRPDGYSIHLSESERVEYVKAYWDSMPDTAPDEYERPSGSAYLAEVSDELFEKLCDAKAAKKVGVRCIGTPPARS